MTEPPPETEVPAPAAAPTPPTAPPRRKRGLLFRAALAGASLLVGLAASVALGLASKKDAGHDSAEKPARPAEPVVPPEPVPPAVRLDTLIRAGSFDEALELCHTLTDVDKHALAYREALCLEGLGRWAEATEEYKHAEDHEADVAAWARAVLGRARCGAAEGHHAEARELLDRVSLRSGHPDCHGRRVLAECLYLRARLELLELGRRPPPDPLNPNALAWPDLATTADRIPECLPTAAHAESPEAPEVGSGKIEVRPAEDPHGEPAATAHLPPKPVLAQLEILAKAAGLKLRVDPEVAKRAVAHVAAVDVELAPLGEVVAALAGSCEAGWQIDGDELVVGGAPVPPAERGALVAGALRRAVAAAPTHPSGAAARVALANVELEAGRAREAASALRQLLENKPNAREALHAAYNLGLVELRQQNFASARNRFLEVVDRGDGGKWAELGWWWIARTHLDAGDTTSARRPLLSAVGGKARRITSAAALGLAACELLDGDSAAARDAIDSHRIDPSESHAALEELFVALLRYRVSPSENRKEVLLGAIRHADAGRAIGPAGVLLAGQAYRDAGEPDRMVALYDAEAELARGPLAARMTFAAAERFDALDRRHDARQRYLAVTAIDPRGLGAQAELRVAALAARDGRGAECLRRCRALLDRDGVEQNEVLIVLGRGYELVADYRRAAECFAGRVPAE